MEIDDDPRMHQLPSDAARWAWIVTLAKAKQRTTPGVWESEAHLTATLKRRGRFVDDFLAAGLLEKNGHGIKVKQWERWQTDPKKDEK